jgi:hypothetical protein
MDSDYAHTNDTSNETEQAKACKYENMFMTDGELPILPAFGIVAAFLLLIILEGLSNIGDTTDVSCNLIFFIVIFTGLLIAMHDMIKFDLSRKGFLLIRTSWHPLTVNHMISDFLYERGISFTRKEQTRMGLVSSWKYTQVFDLYDRSVKIRIKDNTESTGRSMCGGHKTIIEVGPDTEANREKYTNIRNGLNDIFHFEEMEVDREGQEEWEGERKTNGKEGEEEGETNKGNGSGNQ